MIPTGGGLFRTDLLFDGAYLLGVVRRHVHHIGGAGSQPVGDGGMREGGDQRLALRRTRRDRRTPDAEPAAREVDVVQLAAIDEPPGRRITDLSVVLPAVPQPPDHLDVVAGFVEQIPDQLGRGGLLPVCEPERGDVAPPEMACLGLARADLDPPAGTAGADVVEGGDRLGDVEGLGMGDRHSRHESDAPGMRGDPSGDRDRIETSAYLVSPIVRALVTRGLPRQGVLDRHEVQQTALGLVRQVGPVPGGEQVVGPSVGLPPCGGMPARAIERDSKVQCGGWGHRSVSPCSDRTGSAGPVVAVAVG